jgi:hypothetical protein
MFTCMATIRVRTREGHTHTIEVAGDEETALRDFRERTGPFASTWLEIQTTSHATTLTPYDEIIEVTILHP